MIIHGPGSINILKNPSRSRKNRFNMQGVPAVLLAFTATVVGYLDFILVLTLTGLQLYFLLHGAGNFESNPEGDEDHKNFFSNRVDEINALGPRTHKQLFSFLEEEVFGVKKKEATAEQRRQKELSAAQLQAIKAQAAREEAEEEGSGDKNGRDDQEGDK